MNTNILQHININIQIFRSKVTSVAKSLTVRISAKR